MPVAILPQPCLSVFSALRKQYAPGLERTRPVQLRAAVPPDYIAVQLRVGLSQVRICWRVTQITHVRTRVDMEAVTVRGRLAFGLFGRRSLQRHVHEILRNLRQQAVHEQVLLETMRQHQPLPVIALAS